jgi:mRNA m6A methyltransferase catalytic subunit
MVPLKGMRREIELRKGYFSIQIERIFHHTLTTDDNEQGRRRFAPVFFFFFSFSTSTTLTSSGKKTLLQGIEGVDYHVGSVDDLDPSEWHVPPHCIPVHANVTTYDWSRLINAFGAADAAAAAAVVAGAGASSSSPSTAAANAEAAKAAASLANPDNNTGNGFDAIMMDPPWQLATANPTRGVALGYSQLTDADIENLPIPELQPKSGYLFVWVINAKYKFCLDLFDKWGYE